MFLDHTPAVLKTFFWLRALESLLMMLRGLNETLGDQLCLSASSSSIQTSLDCAAWLVFPPLCDVLPRQHSLY